jgi:hypothetical protein
MKTALSALALVGALILAVNTIYKPKAEAEDPWAKQSTEEMMTAAVQLVQAKECSFTLTKEVIAEISKNVDLAVKKFGEYDVNIRAKQLHQEIMSKMTVDEFCAGALYQKE